MALNPNYEAIGKAFTTQYYQMFDNPATRPQLQALYNAEQSLLSFEGQQMQVTSHSPKFISISHRGQCSRFRILELQNNNL